MIGGIILCGGQSRRMGRPKAWLPFGPEVLLQRVVRILSEVARPIVVVASPAQALPKLPVSIVIVRDSIANRGPVQGLATGLRALPLTCELVYVTATDAPFLAPFWITRLAEMIGENDLALPDVEGRLHPLAAIYRRSTAISAVEDLLEEGRFRLLDLLDRLRTIRIKSSDLVEVDPTLATLKNLNTLKDYKQALIDIEREFRNPVP